MRDKENRIYRDKRLFTNILGTGTEFYTVCFKKVVFNFRKIMQPFRIIASTFGTCLCLFVFLILCINI